MTKINCLFVLSAALLVSAFSGCEKNISEPDTLSSKEQLLTAKVWLYNEYFSGYNQTSAVVTYKIGKPNNLRDLSQNRVSFKPDKTYFEINEGGDTLKGTWRLLNNETQLEIINSTGSYSSDIITLSGTSLIWHDPQRNTYAKMLPTDFNQLPTVSANKLTGKKWIYTEYFTNFSQNSTRLAYKEDKPNNLLDLGKNCVTFNKDGSVSEIDENGNSVPGTWKLITIGSLQGLEVRNYTGVQQSVIINLDDSNFVWYNPVVNRYGKMIAANTVDTLAVSARAKLLCAHSWLYTEYFSNYSFASAELSYKRDKSNNNPKNFAANLNTFRLDGSYSEIDQNGITLNGKWEFLENETKLKVENSIGTFISHIIKLDSTEFIWHDTNLNTYGKMAVSPFRAGYSYNINKLTGKIWTYYEYFRDYNTFQSALVYKRERSVNALPLDPNTVMFNNNGTFNELNELGQVINGTWEIINGNQLRTVSVIGGTHIATIIQMDENNLIWYNPTLNTYGKMVVKNLGSN